MLDLLDVADKLGSVFSRSATCCCGCARKCGLAVIEHVRIDPPYRRRGLARRLVAAAVEGRADWTWSTTCIADNLAAQGFAEAGLWPGPPLPRWCEHMAAADDLMP